MDNPPSPPPTQPTNEQTSTAPIDMDSVNLTALLAVQLHKIIANSQKAAQFVNISVNRAPAPINHASFVLSSSDTISDAGTESGGSDAATTIGDNDATDLSPGLTNLEINITDHNAVAIPATSGAPSPAGPILHPYQPTELGDIFPLSDTLRDRLLKNTVVAYIKRYTPAYVFLKVYGGTMIFTDRRASHLENKLIIKIVDGGIISFVGVVRPKGMKKKVGEGLWWDEVYALQALVGEKGKVVVEALGWKQTTTAA